MSMAARPTDPVRARRFALRPVEDDLPVERSFSGVEEMNSKPIKIPGPDHPITVTPTKGRVTVTVNGKRVADTNKALTLKEAAYPAVQYIPRKDVDMTQLQRTSHQTYCPYKGECAYYSIPAGGGTFGQRRLDLRGSLWRRNGNPGIPGVLPGPGRRHRSRRRRLSRPSSCRSHLLEQEHDHQKRREQQRARAD
jgi:uncharacterized protein (DUF427 family)